MGIKENQIILTHAVYCWLLLRMTGCVVQVTDLQMCLLVSCNLLHSRWLCCSRSRPPGTCGWGTGGCPAPWAPARRSFSRGCLPSSPQDLRWPPPPAYDPVPRLFGEHRPVPGTQIPAGANLSHCTHTHNHQLQKHIHSIHIRTTITLIHRLHNTHIWTLISPWQLWQMIQTPPAAVNIKLTSCDQNRVQKNSSI